MQLYFIGLINKLYRLSHEKHIKLDFKKLTIR